MKLKEKMDIIVESVSVDSNQYQNNNAGKNPKGFGHWIFAKDKNGG